MSSPDSPFPSENEVKLQFVAALDAWVRLEHACFKLMYVLLKPIEYSRAHLLFTSINGFQAQRETINALSEDRISDDALRQKVDGLMGRARSLATKRNRIVHGRWRHFAQERHGKRYVVLVRYYHHPNPKELGPEGPRRVFALKGKLFFFMDDLKRCENEFRAVAEAINDILFPVAGDLGVSRFAEVQAESVTEWTIETSPPSGHPPETP